MSWPELQDLAPAAAGRQGTDVPDHHVAQARLHERPDLLDHLVDAAGHGAVRQQLGRRLAASLLDLRRRHPLGNELRKSLEGLAQRVAQPVTAPHGAGQQQRHRAGGGDLHHLLQRRAPVASENQLDLQRRLEARQVAPRLRRAGVDAAQSVAVLVRAQLLGRIPAVGVASGQPQHARRVRRDPDDRSPALVQRRGEQRPVEAPERAVEIDRLAAALPQAAHDRQRLFEPRHPFAERNAVRLRVLALAVADAEDGAAAGQVVERDEGLRQRGRMAPERLGDAGADAHPAVAGRHRPHQDEGIEEGVRRRHQLRRRGLVRSPHRARHEAQVVIGDEQGVDPEQLADPRRRALQPQRRRAARLHAHAQVLGHRLLVGVADTPAGVRLQRTRSRRAVPCSAARFTCSVKVDRKEMRAWTSAC